MDLVKYVQCLETDSVVFELQALLW